MPTVRVTTLLLAVASGHPLQAAAVSPPAAVIVQSHRGAGELQPENTLEAFELGWELKTYPEADVRATSDGVIVAFHDKNLKRLVKNVAPELAEKGIADLNWAEVSKLDVGSWKAAEFAGRRIPRLSEVFRRMAGRPERHLYLDVKEVSLPALAAEVRAHRVEAQVILASPDHEKLRAWKRLIPESGTLLWMGGREPELREKLAKAREANFEGLTQIQFHVHYKAPLESVTRESVNPFSPSDDFLREAAQELRSRGILVQAFPWGGTTPATYWKLLDLGVQAFATDHPKVTLEAISQYEAPTASTGEGSR